jgi:hypothetical protein
MKIAISPNRIKITQKTQYVQYFLIALFLFFFGNTLKAQPDTTFSDKKDSIKTSMDSEHILFSSDDPLHIALQFDIHAFIKNRYDPKYQEAEITLRFSNEDSLIQHIKLKPSGLTRRTFCFFPPMHLNFKGSELLGNEPSDQHTLKLVAHCQNERIYTLYVLREYLAYRLYNLITPYSLKVRLLIIDYLDTNDQKFHFTRFGFLIENSYSMAERTHSVLQKDIKYYKDNLKIDEATRVGVFEYMIGNTDWAASLLHNIRLLKLSNGQHIYVPFDFDYSGFVGTDYSLPDPRLGLDNVKERLYNGYCAGDEIFNKTLTEFDGFKNDIYKLIQEFDYLNKREKKEILSYLDEFFSQLNDKPSLIKKLRSRC